MTTPKMPNTPDYHGAFIGWANHHPKLSREIKKVETQWPGTQTMISCLMKAMDQTQLEEKQNRLIDILSRALTFYLQPGEVFGPEDDIRMEGFMLGLMHSLPDRTREAFVHNLFFPPIGSKEPSKAQYQIALRLHETS